MSSIVLSGLRMSANSCRTFRARRCRSCLGSTTPGGWMPGGKGETRPGDMRGGVTPASLSPGSTPSSVSTSSSLAWAGRARGGCHHDGRGGTLGVSGGANTSSDRLRLARGQLWCSPSSSSSSPTSTSSWLLLLLTGAVSGCL